MFQNHRFKIKSTTGTKQRYNVMFSEEDKVVMVTEDNIVIYNIYLSNIPEGLTENDLRKYFSKYCGEISSIAIINKKIINSAFRYGFVNFKKPESALQAIRDSEYFKPYGMLVRAADSWKQPRKEIVKNEIEIVDNVETADDKAEGTTILDLNDDCLLQIFSYLTIYQLSKLSKVCHRFQNLFKLTFRLRKKIDDTIGGLTLMQLRQVLQKVGPYIEQAKFCKIEKMRHIALVLQCPNIQYFEMRDIPQKHNYLYEKLSWSFNLKVLKLINCLVTDDVCSILLILQRIESLDLSYNHFLTGKHLSKFKKLKHLQLANCPMVRPEYFIDLCRDLNLEELNITDCSGLDLTPCFDFDIYLSGLRKLAISLTIRTFDWKSITKLETLKSIRLNHDRSEPFADIFFEQLAKKQPQILEELELVSCFLNVVKKNSIYKMTKLEKLLINEQSMVDPQVDNTFLSNIAKFLQLKKLILLGCKGISSVGILMLFDISSSIEYLNVSHCIQINNDTIIDIMEKIKSKRNYLPCKLVVGGTSVKENLINDLSYIAAKDFISLSFDETIEM